MHQQQVRGAGRCERLFVGLPAPERELHQRRRGRRDWLDHPAGDLEAEGLSGAVGDGVERRHERHQRMPLPEGSAEQQAYRRARRDGGFEDRLDAGGVETVGRPSPFAGGAVGEEGITQAPRVARPHLGQRLATDNGEPVGAKQHGALEASVVSPVGGVGVREEDRVEPVVAEFGDPGDTPPKATLERQPREVDAVAGA